MGNKGCYVIKYNYRSSCNSSNASKVLPIPKDTRRRHLKGLVGENEV